MSANPPSPSSSPRLPSPPPMAEDQSGAQSPSLTASELKLRPLVAPAQEQAQASRRIRPGTKAVDMAEGPPLLELTEIDSSFQLTEHLKALHFAHTHLPTVTLPVTAPVASLLSTPPPGTDRALWLYELCRFLVQKVNTVVISLFADHPPCSAATCPEMRASEWQYLCAVHDPPKACCAIDYCCHTLDWAANVLTNPKHFPSRLAFGGAEHTAPQHQVRQLTNIFRRVYRIFAHAWFSHRDMFWRVEGKTGLYVFFKTVCDFYNLLPDDGYTIPAEAEAEPQDEHEPRETEPQLLDTTSDSAVTVEASTPPPPSILKRPSPPATAETIISVEEVPSPAPTPINTVVSTGATARRHRQTPSTGASPVETVMEENEDEEHSADDTELQPSPDEDVLEDAQQNTESDHTAPQQSQIPPNTSIESNTPSTEVVPGPYKAAESSTPQTSAATSTPSPASLGAGAQDTKDTAAGTVDSSATPDVSRWEEVVPKSDDSGRDTATSQELRTAKPTAENESAEQESGTT